MPCIPFAESKKISATKQSRSFPGLLRPKKSHSTHNHSPTKKKHSGSPSRRRLSCGQVDINNNTSNALKSAHDFWAKMQDVPFRDAFYEYLLVRRCTENLIFYEAVKKWELITGENKWAEANNINNNYIADNAPSQVNISAVASKKIKQELQSTENTPKNLSKSVFDPALREVELLLQLELLPMFVMLRPQPGQKGCLIL